MTLTASVVLVGVESYEVVQPLGSDVSYGWNLCELSRDHTSGVNSLG